MTEEEMDKIARQIRAPLRDLSTNDALMLLMFVAFQLHDQVAFLNGMSEGEAAERLRSGYEAYHQDNPYPKRH